MSSDSAITTVLKVVLTCALLLPSTLAFAGTEEARQYFKQAKQAYGEGEFEKAASLLEKAYAEEANLTYQYNRIRALEGAGQYEKALEVLEAYERPMLDAKGFEDVPKLKAALQKKVGDSGGAATDSGETKTADSGDTDDMADPDAKKPGGTDEGASANNLKPLGWGLVGLGAASAGSAAIFGSYLTLNDEITQKLKAGDPLNDAADRKTVNTNQAITVTSIAVSAGALIGGGVILMQGMGQEKGADASPTASTNDPKLRVAPFSVKGGGGAVLDVQF